MIKLYRSITFFDVDSIIVDNESFFNDYVSARYLGQEELTVMKLIDGAELLDRETGKIQTPYGICSIEDLSTGCKTILNIIFIYKNRQRFLELKAISLNECGRNSLDIIFEFIDTTNFDINFILEHDDDVFECKQHNFLINGKYKLNRIPLGGEENDML